MRGRKRDVISHIKIQYHISDDSSITEPTEGNLELFESQVDLTFF